MSRAFVKESEDNGDELPERAVSPNRNLVTEAGLAQIGVAIRRFEAALVQARALADKAAMASAQRDLRYWQQRRASAELVPHAPGADRVRFGATVTLALDDGTERTLKIVGEDEAEPAAGTIAYTAPVAVAMIGAQAGERVPIGLGEGEIVGIR